MSIYLSSAAVPVLCSTASKEFNVKIIQYSAVS